MSGQSWGSSAGHQPGRPPQSGRPPQQGSGPPPAQPWSQPGGFGQSSFGQGQFGQSSFGQPQSGPGQFPRGPVPQDQFGPGGPAGWQGQPPRKTSRLGRILIIMGGLAVVALIGLVVVSLTRSGEVAYVNEGYTPPPAETSPPPLPEAGSEQDAINYVEANPLYDQVMPAPVRCDGVAPVDLETISNADLETHLDNLMGCLVAAWHTPVEAAGFQMPRPPVTVYTDDNLVTSACGDTKPANASYCTADQAIYYSADLHKSAPALLEANYGAEAVLAHEFGHAVQARIGILHSKYVLMQTAASELEAYEINRRSEAQADCLAGLFLLSASTSLGVDETEYANLTALFEFIGGAEADPESTHPYGASRSYWLQLGVSTDAIGECNTFTAPSEYVR
ncbi:MAG: neutral zinc metallopeptidase [Propionibacteriaceae bacterium]